MTELKIIKPQFKSYKSVVAITESISYSDFKKSLDPSSVYNHFSILDIPSNWVGIGVALPAATVVFDLAESSISIRDNGTRDYVVKNQNLFSDLTDIIYRKDGIIEKFPGDGISAHFPLFGNESPSDAIKRAFGAMAQMDMSLKNNQKLNRNQYRFTLTYGNDTIVTKFGNQNHEELISIGHSVNVAHKLEKYVKREKCFIGMDEECRNACSINSAFKVVEYSLEKDLFKDPYSYSESWFGVKY